jgi:hypothetical protein
MEEGGETCTPFQESGGQVVLRAKVVLKQEQMDRLMAGKPVVIRLRDTELEITYNNSVDSIFDELMRLIKCK